MYGIDERDQLMTYIDGVFVPLARPTAAADVIVNVAGFGTCHWDDEDGVCEGLKQVIMGPQCFNAALHGFECSECAYELDQDDCERLGDFGYCPQCGSAIIRPSGKTCGESNEN